MKAEVQVGKRAGMVGAATLLSRVLGLVREQAMAILFGAGFFTDAFNVAFRVPNLLRDLFAEGAMSSAFVPTFTRVLEEEGEAKAWAFGRQLMSTLLAVLLAVCTVGWLAAPWLVRAFAPGFSAVPGKLDLTVFLTRVMLPFLPLMALSAAAMGMLNSRSRFAVPALAPALLNLGMVIVGVSLIPVCRAAHQPAILAMAIGVLVGGLLQFGVQLPTLAREGFRFRLEVPRRHPGVERVAFLMLPATVGLAATQLNIFVSTIIASLLQQGSVSWLAYAFRLMQLPIGVFGVALATVSLPALSQAAVAGDMKALKGTLSATLRLVFLLTVPAALWLASLARPVIALLYEHGRFGPHDTTMTAGALVMYCIGLPAFAAVGVLTRTFYALGNTRTPVQASFVSVALNLALNLALMRPLGHLGLALSTAVTSIVNMLQLGFYLRRRLGPLEGRRMARTAARVSAAAIAAAGGNVLLLRVLGPHWEGRALTELLVVGSGFVLSVVIGGLVMRVLKVEELGAVGEIARAMVARVTPRREG